MELSELNKLSEIKVSYSQPLTFKKMIKVDSSQKAAEVFRHFIDPFQIDYKEVFNVMYVTRSNRLLGVVRHSEGGLNGSLVDVRQIIGVACTANASGIILCHNHPSGNLKPSDVDKKLTEQIKSSCELMGIQLLDHIILTKEEHFSFADESEL